MPEPLYDADDDGEKKGVAAALAVGLFASMPYSPLEWARLIATRQYTP